MNHATIAIELVRAVRGDRAQGLLSRKLGFRGNQLYRWESGLRKISWKDFCLLCLQCETPLSQSLGIINYREDPQDVAALIAHIIGSATQTKLSEETGISRYALIRWLNGKGVPSLDEVLTLIHHCQYLLLELIDELVEVKNVPTAWAAYQVRDARKKIYYRFPMAPAVVCCLQLDDYAELAAHSEGFVASKLGLSVDLERTVLAELEKAGKIAMRDGKFHVDKEQLELTDCEDIRSFVTYWLERAVEIVKNEQNPYPILNNGLDIYPTSSKMAQRVKKEYMIFFHKVRSLLAQDDEQKDSVVVFNSLFLDLAKLHGEPLPPSRGLRLTRSKRLSEPRPEL